MPTQKLFEYVIVDHGSDEPKIVHGVQFIFAVDMGTAKAQIKEKMVDFDQTETVDIIINEFKHH